MRPLYPPALLTSCFFSRAEPNANRHFSLFISLFFYLCGRRGSLRGQRATRRGVLGGVGETRPRLWIRGGVWSRGGRGAYSKEAQDQRRARRAGSSGARGQKTEPKSAKSGDEGRRGKIAAIQKLCSHMTDWKPHLSGRTRRLPGWDPVALMEDYKFSVLFSSSSFCVVFCPLSFSSLIARITSTLTVQWF